MKKILGCLLAAVTMLSSFTACDKDKNTTLSLSGDWHGTLYSVCKYQKQGELRMHKAEPTETYLHMVPKHLYGTTGTGVEIDYFAAPCPFDYIYTEFEWKVRDGDIEFYFDNPDLDFVIYKYRLHVGLFYGEIGELRDKFEFVKDENYNTDFIYEKQGAKLAVGESAPTTWVHYRDTGETRAMGFSESDELQSFLMSRK